MVLPAATTAEGSGSLTVDTQLPPQKPFLSSKYTVRGCWYHCALLCRKEVPVDLHTVTKLI